MIILNFALKSVGCVFYKDATGTFFAFKSRICKCRSPPVINLNFKKFELIGGNYVARLPIRNKSKDNPYTLGYDEEKFAYTVEFVNGRKQFHKIEITEELYNVFDKFELEDIFQIHKYRSHIEHSELREETLIVRMLEKPITIEKEVEDKLLLDEIKEVIASLPIVQKRRLQKYYFKDKKLDGVSIDIAIKKITQKLKN